MFIRVLTLSLAIFAVALPASAAHATTFEGSCDIGGTYTFDGDEYSIAGEPIDGGCNGALNDVDSGWVVIYTSNGSVSGGCGGGFLGGGTGQLDFYSVNLDTQVLQYADTLDVEYGGGIISPLGASVRMVSGATSGTTAEVGRFRNCGEDNARYAGSFSGVLGD